MQRMVHNGAPFFHGIMLDLAHLLWMARITCPKVIQSSTWSMSDCAAVLWAEEVLYPRAEEGAFNLPQELGFLLPKPDNIPMYSERTLRSMVRRLAPCQSSTNHNAAVVENAPAPEDTQQNTQKSDLNLISLERNSFNFLESVLSPYAAEFCRWQIGSCVHRYAKMQYQTLSKPDGQLTFETVVPKSTSTRHVAAAAFYHCLGSFLVSVATYIRFIAWHRLIFSTRHEKFA